jgi:hypothetical protein
VSTMKTLYDLLGALPEDDADDIRAAFRKAVKSAHPDINPGDPDAAIKFRQIVRANEILVDQDQRAVYDHLLDLARIEKEAASKQAVAAAIHKVASGTMVLAGLSVVAIGGYLLFMQLSETPIAPSVAPWADAVRKTSHSIAQVLARPSFAVVHKPSSVKSQDSISGESRDVADAGSLVTATPPADATRDARVADAGPAPRSATARDAAWDDRNDRSNNAIAYLEVAPKYPAAHIESTVAPFGFTQSSSAPNGGAQNGSAPNNSARNSNAQNSIPPNSPVPNPNSVGTSKHVEKAGTSAPASKPFRMPPPPHAEIPVMPEPRPPRLTAVQDLSRQESPGSSVMR